MESKTGILAMITDFNFERNEIFLTDFLVDEQIIVQEKREAFEMIEEAFYYALNRNMFLFVEYDKTRGIILESVSKHSKR